MLHLLNCAFGFIPGNPPIAVEQTTRFRSHPQSSVGLQNQSTFTARLNRELTHLFLYIRPLCNIIDDMLHPFPEINEFTTYLVTISGPSMN